MRHIQFNKTKTPKKALICSIRGFLLVFLPIKPFYIRTLVVVRGTLNQLFSCEFPTNKKIYDENGVLVKESIEREDTIYTIDYSQTGDTSSVLISTLDGKYVRQKEYVQDKVFYENIFHGDTSNYTQKMFFKNGRLKSVTEFRGGQKNGQEKGFFETGEIRVILNYVNNVPIGSFLQYYRNGSIFLETDSIGNGKTYMYDSLGNLRNITTHKDFEIIRTEEVEF